MKELIPGTEFIKTEQLEKRESTTISSLENTLVDAIAVSVIQKNPNAALVNVKITDNKFVCDFDLQNSAFISRNDIPTLTDSIIKISNSSNISTAVVSLEQGLLFAKTDIHKQAILLASDQEKIHAHYIEKNLIIPRDDNQTFYSGKITEDNFIITNVSGAYWQGDEKNRMIQRIQGLVFKNKSEKKDYLKRQEEAEKRNHIRLGKELKLFTFDETAPGEAYWLPKGLVLYNELIKFSREVHSERGYQEIATPLISRASLYETSGHMAHYKDAMFISDTPEGQYVLKPMNCPNAMVVFKTENRTYKDLPLRFSDIDRLHRFERSGEINGLLRGRAFQQDDAHIFIDEKDIGQEFENVFEITDLFYKTFGLDYSFRLSTRGKDFMGNIDVWDKAEDTLRGILEDQKIKRNKTFSVSEGDAAFYGPKIDILMDDALGRKWQMGTIQLDFQLPGRFDLRYMDKDGSFQTPVLMHRVIYGSLERFIGIITEHFGGEFPTWLSPEQVTLIPVSDNNSNYVKNLKNNFQSKGIRVRISDDKDLRLGKKIYEAKSQKVPYVLVVGDKEEAEGLVAVNTRQLDPSINNPPFSIPVSEFTNQLVKEINNKSLKPQIKI